MKRRLLLCLITGLLFSTVHRLPAPIQEASESPTPIPDQSAKPKAKHEAKPKAASENSQSQTKRNPFDGTWVGTENLGSVGTIQSTQVISESGTMVRSKSRVGVFTWKAKCNGKTMQWNVNTQYGSGVRIFTPNPDGKTALMIFESSAVYSSVIFHKITP